MAFTTLDVQARLHALGFEPGPLDGLMGPRTRAALDAALAQRRARSAAELFHPSGLHRIILHWTAGAYGDIALERASYHLLILEDGRAVPGDWKPEANATCVTGRYAAHTRALNTGSIGVALDAMAGAVEHPFSVGCYPITRVQLDAMATEVADLCLTYDIPVSRWTVLTHAEVQPTLGIWQRAKWDITWLPGMATPGDPVAVGDRLRAMIRAALPIRRAA